MDRNDGALSWARLDSALTHAVLRSCLGEHRGEIELMPLVGQHFVFYAGCNAFIRYASCTLLVHRSAQGDIELAM